MASGVFSLRSACLVVALAGALACSAGKNGFSGGDGGDGNSSASGPGGLGGGGGLNIGGNNTGGNGCENHCSSDLHSLLDCNDMVIETCPPNLGCSPTGGCVDPCQAAQDNASTIGCDFYSATPGPMNENTGSCFAALIANTWTTPVTISAGYQGVNFDINLVARVPMGSGPGLTYAPLPNGQLDPGQIAIVFLSQFNSGQIFWTPCPPGTTAGINGNTHVNPTGVGNAFHLTTDRPVVAYDIYPYGGASSYVTSATLLVPTPTWGDNFVSVDAYEVDPNLVFANGLPFVQIVAAEDGTQVTVNPKVAITGGTGVPPAPANTPQMYTLNRGQLLQFMQDQRLAGSPVAATKPISVWGGSSCMNIPIGNYACDSGHQQLLPVKSVGNEYAAVRYRDRSSGANESVPYTFVGMVDGTQLTYDPAPPPGAPTALSTGQLVVASGSEPFVVKSQDADHPFYLAVHMTGAGAVPNNFNNDGDPDYVNVIPPLQYLAKYLFLTDPTYGNTHLVFTRGKAKDGTFKDVTLDCIGSVGGWQPIGSGAYEYTRVDLVLAAAPQGSCNNGVHVAESQAPFGLTVWGWDVTASYGYPAGMSVKPINTVFVPPTPE
jgi:IgGFc binding protein